MVENKIIFQVEPLIVFLNEFYSSIFIENNILKNNSDSNNIKFINKKNYISKNNNNKINNNYGNNSNFINNNYKYLISDYLRLIEYAWGLILKNHAHDSIGGCSIDEVHKQMIYRYKRVNIILNQIIEESMNIINSNFSNWYNFFYKLFNHYLYKKIENKQIYRLKLFNTLQVDFNDYIEVSIPFITEIDNNPDYKNGFKKGGYYFLYEKVYLFDIVDDKGNKIEYDILKIEKDKKGINKPTNKLPEIYKYDNYIVLFKTKIKSLGFKDYFIISSDVPSFYNKVKFYNNFLIENEYFSIQINQSGNLKLINKKVNEIYENFIRFRLDTDIGDGYNFYKPVNGTSIYIDRFESYEIKNYKNKDVLTLHFMHSLNGNYHNNINSYENFDFTLQIELYKGKSYINFKLNVLNNLSNVRFAVYFPLNKKYDKYFVYTPYDIISREIKNIDDRSFTEPIPEFGITNGFCYVINSNCNNNKNFNYNNNNNSNADILINNRNYDCINNIVALFTKGNPEIGVFNSYDDFSVMGITLFRSVSKTVFTNGECDGLLHKNLVFEFSLRFYDNVYNFSDRNNFLDNIYSKNIYKNGSNKFIEYNKYNQYKKFNINSILLFDYISYSNPPLYNVNTCNLKSFFYNNDLLLKNVFLDETMGDGSNNNYRDTNSSREKGKIDILIDNENNKYNKNNKHYKNKKNNELNDKNVYSNINFNGLYYKDGINSYVKVKGSFVIISIRLLSENVIFIRGFNPENSVLNSEILKSEFLKYESFENKDNINSLMKKNTFNKDANVEIEFNIDIKKCFKLDRLYNGDIFFDYFSENIDEKNDIDKYKNVNKGINKNNSSNNKKDKNYNNNKNLINTNNIENTKMRKIEKLGKEIKIIEIKNKNINYKYKINFYAKSHQIVNIVLFKNII